MLELFKKEILDRIAYFRIQINHLPSPHRPSHESSDSLPRFEILCEYDTILKIIQIIAFKENHKRLEKQGCNW